jgi:NAD(P)-dependent dehydrogenase (short-subunit alcohol dehydrogenase family)
MWRLEGKTAIVLGGTGVLGQAMAEGLVSAGARVALIGRDAKKLGALADRIGAEWHACDVSSRAELESTGRRIVENSGSLGILLSGIGGNTPSATLKPDADFFSLDEESLRAVVDQNLFLGAVLPILSLGPFMPQGSIVTVSSVAAELPLTRVGGYAAAKAALASFTRFAALELGRRTQGRLRVNAIQPGFFVADQNRDLLIDRHSGAPTERGRAILEHTPAGRFGEPQDLIGALLFLASDASRFVTGTVIPVDGGFTAHWGV